VHQLDTVILWSSLFGLFLREGRLAHWRAKAPKVVEWYASFGDQAAFKTAVGTFYIQILPHLKVSSHFSFSFVFMFSFLTSWDKKKKDFQHPLCPVHREIEPRV